MSAVLAFAPLATGCGNPCEKRCDELIRCMNDLQGGKVQPGTSMTKKECLRQCKRDKKFRKQADKLCR